jgi:hypothetical protein
MKMTAVLNLPKSTKKVAAFGQSIVSAVTDNASFPSPTPPLATVSADLAAFQAAESAALARTKGAVETRNAKLVVLKNDLELLMANVQSVANANESTAESVITGAGFAVRKTASRTKAPLEVEQGSLSGSVKLVAKAVARRASYEWQYSLDQKTWTEAPSTLQAKTVIVGLTPATTYYFQVRPVIKGGQGNWGQMVSFLVK